MAVTAFDLLIALGVDSSGVDSGLSQAGKSVSGFAAHFSAVLSTLGKGALMAAEHGIMALVDGLQTATGAAVNLTRQAVSAYGEYQQLVGGTELLFGEASDFVMEKSKKAYKTVQMSQAEYLRQVNGFSTGLKNSLGGDALAAAKLADRIVNAEADVVAATGVSAEMVQNAFNGLMRNNYTMLDNLQLGIKPTKEGMQDLINTVNEWNAANGRATAYQLENLADMQSAVLDYIEMQGISNYAAKEAGDTIQGSMAALQASWQDIIANLGNKEADMGGLITNFVDTAVATLTGNLLPTVTTVLGGIGNMVQTIVPKLVNEGPKLLLELIPQVASGIQELINGVLTALPKLIIGVRDNLGTLVSSVFESIDGIVADIETQAPFIVNHLTMLIKTVTDLLVGQMGDFPSFFSRIVGDILPLMETVNDAFMKALPELVNGFTAMITDSQFLGAIQEMIQSAADFLINNTGTILESILKIGQAVVQAISTGILPKIQYTLVPAIVSVFESIAENLPAYITVLTDLIKAIVDTVVGIVEGNASEVLAIAIAIVGALADGILTLLPILLEGAMSLIDALVAAITANIEPFMEMAIAIINSLIGFILEYLPEFLDFVAQTIEIIVQAIVANAALFMPAVVEIIMTLFNGFTEMLPVLFKVFTDICLILSHVLIDNLPLFLESAIEIISVIVAGLVENSPKVIAAIITIVGLVFQTFREEIARIDLDEIGGKIIDGIIRGFTNGFGRVSSAIGNFGNFFTETVENVFKIHSPSKLMADRVGKYLALGIGEGFESNMPDIGGMINTDFNITGAPGGNQVVAPIYIGDRLIDTVVIEAGKRNTYRTGGR